MTLIVRVSRFHLKWSHQDGFSILQSDTNEKTLILHEITKS